MRAQHSAYAIDAVFSIDTRRIPCGRMEWQRRRQAFRTVEKHMEWQRRLQASQTVEKHGMSEVTPGIAKSGETHGMAEATPGTANGGETWNDRGGSRHF